MLVKFEGYAPDADPTMPGVLTDCNALLPSLKGFRAAPSAQSAGIDTLSAPCLGAAALQKLDESTRVIAGTSTKLYEISGTTWTDRSTTAGYSLGADQRWRFAQFGDVALAAAKTENLQASTTAAFSLAGAAAPKASIVETVGQFVMLADTNETTYGDSPDRWWCSAIADYTDWVPAISTQCATGRLTSVPGKIRAMRRFGDQVIAYKQRGMFRGVYVGAPLVWEFAEIPGNVGAMTQEAIVNVGTPEDPRHIFMGFEDFYTFDGSRPIPIGTNRVKENVFGDLNRDYSENCIALHDSANSLVFFFYPVADSTSPDKCVVYNYRTGKWGRDDRQIQAALEYIQPSITYAGLGSAYGTYGALPNVSYASSLFIAGSPIPAVFSTTNVLQTLNAAPTTWGYTTGDIGDDMLEVFVSRVKPRFITNPSSGTQINYYRQSLGDSLSSDASATLNDSRFDCLREARWHRFAHSFIGAGEVTALNLVTAGAGSE
jgi:hypothetical protein